MDYNAYDALLHHIFKQTQGDVWFKPSEKNIHAGVYLRVDTGVFHVFPYDNTFLEPFEASMRVLNPIIAVKIRSVAIHATLTTVKPDVDAIYVDENTHIQILDSILLLGSVDKERCGAFIRDERVLVVWSYHLDTTILTCRNFEEKLIKLIWDGHADLSSSAPSVEGSSNASSNVNVTEKVKEQHTEADAKEVPIALEAEAVHNKPLKKTWFWGLSYFVANKADVEKITDGPSLRPVRLFAPFYNGLGVVLSIFFIALRSHMSSLLFLHVHHRIRP
ncbi:hypothetical protein GSI_05390 [Ganoderma sinense ZZ0214-1]|uniref:DUF7928 domain-containing protein n=1 Tax=Ganoderma sinense ZZ0214-1 TaxID=1077348 RepID=A0A2G8SFY1_9APHY|nr:hypothetical protein GSI_05390 [Ganoderma sinense ZZ0214-1]